MAAAQSMGFMKPSTASRISQRVVKESPEEILLNRPKGGAGKAQTLRDGFDIGFEQNDIGSLAGDVAGFADRSAQVRLLERWRVVQAITDEGDAFTFTLEGFNQSSFAFRPYFRKNTFQGGMPISLAIAEAVNAVSPVTR